MMMDAYKERTLKKLFSIFKRRKKTLFIVFFILLHSLILRNAFLLSNDLIDGDFSATHLVPSLRYEVERVPENPLTQKVHAVNRLAADFAQIYFPSQNFSSLAQAYTRKTLDPWHRPSRYAPFIHAMCSMSICKLNYGDASFLHLVIQLVLFYASFVYVFKVLHVERYTWHGIALVNFCLFLTPVGLSFFERGQFSLYVSLSYLWLVLGILHKKVGYIVLSALFAFVKMTSFLFIFVTLVVWMLNSKNVKELKQSILSAVAFSLTIALLLLCYPDFGVHFFIGIMTQELTFQPAGLSMALLLPRFLAKALPFVLIVLGFLHIQKYKSDFLFLIPFLTGCGIILVTYPTLAYDYSVPCLFCFIPLSIYWARHPKTYTRLSVYVGVYFFPVFLIAASLSKYVNTFFHRENAIIGVYIVSSFVFFGIPALSKLHCEAKKRMLNEG